ncbi:MAG: beta-lactamase family protein [Bacteroidota bacterium]|nr:beta-lactamase family protein [Bacteroidota bacterium]
MFKLRIYLPSYIIMLRLLKQGLHAALLILSFLATTTCFAQDFSKLDNWLETNAQDMGGRAVLMIYKGGKIIYAHVANEMRPRQKMVAKMILKRQGTKANLEDFTPATRGPIASCSKWLSAALVMTFVDEGKLSLLDSVGKFLPTLTQYNKGAITIAQCLSHTTAIKAPSFKEGINEMRAATSMDEAIADIAHLSMEGELGKVFRYSSIGLQIAAAVIEKISGKSFETLFLERLATPLDMHHTDFGKAKVPLPAGGAWSSASDYLNFLVMILNKGVYNGKRILSEAAVAQMQFNRITKNVIIAYSPNEAGSAGYGLGEWVMEASTVSNTARSVSSPGLFGSFPWVDNEKKYCGFLMTFYLKSQGRRERYQELKELVDDLIK